MEAALPRRRGGRKWPTLRAISALVLREMSTTYGRSPGGYIWAILEPVAAVVLLSIIFQVAFGSPPIGVSFPLFYATGVLPMMMYMDLTAKLSQSIQFSRALLAYPNVTYVDAILGRFFLNTLTQLLVFGVVMGGLFIFLDLQPYIDFWRLLNAFGMVLALSFGVGVVNCYLATRYPLWARIYAILNRPLFIISGVLFLADELPDPYRHIVFLNPVAHPVSEMRSAFYPSYHAVYVSSVYVYMIAAILIFFGFLLLRRYNRYLLDEGV